MWRENITRRPGPRHAVEAVVDALQLPQLGELEEHVVRVHRRDDEAGHAVADAAAHEVVAQEGERRVAGQLQQAGAPAVFVHLRAPPGRVAVDRLQVVRDVAIGVVLDLAGSRPTIPLPSPTRARNARSSAPGADRRAEPGSRDTSRWMRIHRPRCHVTRGIRNAACDRLRRQRARESPPPAPASRVRRRRATESSRGSRATRRSSSARCNRPVVDHDAIGVLPRDGDGLVAAVGIDDDDLVGPGDRCQRRAEIRRFVPGDHRDREFRHRWSVLRSGGRGKAGAKKKPPETQRTPRIDHRACSASPAVLAGSVPCQRATCTALPTPLIGTCCTASKSTSDLL